MSGKQNPNPNSFCLGLLFFINLSVFFQIAKPILSHPSHGYEEPLYYELMTSFWQKSLVSRICKITWLDNYCLS